MTTRPARRLSLGQRALCLLAFPALAWLILRNGAIALFAQAQPSLALAFPPPSGNALAADAAERRLAPDARERIAVDALRRDPISAWPFIAAAQAALARADSVRAARLLETAVRRNSRQVDARRRLFQLYLDADRWGEAIDEGLAVARLRPPMADNVMEALLLLLGDARGRDQLAARLRPRPDGRRPWWRDPLVAAAAGHPRQSELDRLLRQLDQAAPAEAADAAGDRER